MIFKKSENKKKSVKLYCCWYFLLMLLFVGVFASGFSFNYSNADVIYDGAGIDVSSCEIVRFTDDHGGFLGDGVTFAEVNCRGHENDVISRISSAAGWKEFPLTENLEKVFDGISAEYSLDDIECGYYYFYDRQSDGDPYSDGEFYLRYSYNFTFAAYDVTAAKLYYYVIDT